jgi:CIC family chloride channel protein
MFKNIFPRLENRYFSSAPILSPKQFIFSSISGYFSRFCSNCIENFAHWVLIFATYVSGNFKKTWFSDLYTIIEFHYYLVVKKKYSRSGARKTE